MQYICRIPNRVGPATVYIELLGQVILCPLVETIRPDTVHLVVIPLTLFRNDPTKLCQHPHSCAYQ